MKIVFLVEEASMEWILKVILPEIIPEEVQFQIVPHQGKQDLQKSISIKLRSWNEPDVRFVIVHDKDSCDCRVLKQDLVNLCKQAGRPDTLVRIACNELEAWYFGDLTAVGQAFDKDISAFSRKSKYRIPDSIGNPKAEIRKIIKNLQQISGAKAIASCMDIERNTSHSFKVFVDGVRRISKSL